MKSALGEGPFAVVYLTSILAAGWPVYLLTGASGGPVRGATNHFWPWAGASGKFALFPGKWAAKVLWSDLGVAVVLAGLVAWAAAAQSAWPVMALYAGPYLFVNFWLVLYTWLQHTDVDVPHFECAPLQRCALPSPPPCRVAWPSSLTRRPQGRRLEPAEGRAAHHRPAVRPGARLSAPPHRQHARGAPRQPHHPALPRAGGHQRAEGRLPAVLPVRPDAHPRGAVARRHQVHGGEAAAHRRVALGIEADVQRLCSSHCSHTNARTRYLSSSAACAYLAVRVSYHRPGSVGQGLRRESAFDDD